MFGTVIPYERLCDCFLGGFDAIIVQAGKLQRVPLSVENGIEDSNAAYSRDIADGMVQLQVHLIQGLLNALRIRACRLHQAVTMPQRAKRPEPFSPFSREANVDILRSAGAFGKAEFHCHSALQWACCRLRFGQHSRSSLAIEWLKFLTYKIEIHVPVDCTQKMMLGYVILDSKVVEE